MLANSMLLGWNMHLDEVTINNPTGDLEWEVSYHMKQNAVYLLLQDSPMTQLNVAIG